MSFDIMILQILTVYLHWLLHVSLVVLNEASAHWKCFHAFERSNGLSRPEDEAGNWWQRDLKSVFH